MSTPLTLLSIIYLRTVWCMYRDLDGTVNINVSEINLYIPDKFSFYFDWFVF